MNGFWSRLRRWTPRTRPTLRIRLALLYALVVVLAGVVLLGITYGRVAATSHVAVVKGPRFLAISASNSSQFGATGPTLHVSGGAPIDQRLPFLMILPGFGGNSGAISASPFPKSPPSPAQLRELLGRSVALQQAVDQKSLLVQGAIALGFVALLGLAIGWIVAGRILRPLQVMTSTVQRLSAENLSGRFALKGPKDELHNLADTFDALLGRLEHSRSAERRFAANVSHELRTPLAVQKTMLEVALSDPNADEESLRELAGRMWQLNQRSRRLIDGLLELARSQRGVQAAVPVDLAAVVRDALDSARLEVATLDLRLEQDLHEATVLGDRVLLERLAGNLIENAARYNAPGGWIHIETQREGELGVLIVENLGALFRQDQVETLFEPFQRGVQERTDTSHGAGLGLSIVHAVAQAHHGDVQAVAREGGGLRIRVDLPVA